MHDFLIAYGSQAVGYLIALFTVATSVGAFIAGRASYKKTMLENSKNEAESWKRMYDVTKEQNEKYEKQIVDLQSEGHEKDKQIAALNGKIEIIIHFMKDVISKDLSAADMAKLQGA